MSGSENSGLFVADLRVTLIGSGADVVDEVSFSVAPHTVFGLVGESGSGKTTVALALLGRARNGLKISSGSVRLGTIDILRLSPDELRGIRGREVAYVPQDPASALNPARKVVGQVREALTVHGESRSVANDRVRELLEEVGLDNIPRLEDSYPHQLSGGQQQRIAIAMALAWRPQVVVLDEPTTGLDVTTQRRILDRLRELCARYGVAGIYVSHDLAVVSGLADRVGVMYAGRLVEMAPTNDLFCDPRHPYTRGLIRAAPSVLRPQANRGIPGRPPRPGNRPSGCSFAPRCSYVEPPCRAAFPEPITLDDSRRWARCRRATEMPELDALDGRDFAAPRKRPPHVAGGHVRVTKLSAYYGERCVLHEVTTEVADGDCLAIVGESGSGKTTLGRCIVGLHLGWTGAIHLSGESLSPGVRNRQRAALSAIQYIFQNPYGSLNPRKTVADLLREPLLRTSTLTRAQATERVSRALIDAVLGDEYVSRYPDELSGGERQRVAIARALVLQPRVLICDEVTSALDVSVQASIVALLRSLQLERGLTMIFITHNLPLVRTIAQTVAVMTDGRIVEQGTRRARTDAARIRLHYGSSSR